MKLELMIEKLANTKLVVHAETADFNANYFYSTTNEIYALYKSLHMVIQKHKGTNYDVITNSDAFAYELRRYANSGQRLANLTQEKLVRNYSKITSVTVKEID